MHDYGHYCRPELVRLLESLSLDAVYERAQGDRLWQRRGGRLVEVLDLVGGFGANFFGHYHPELVAEERRLSEQRVPILAQGSCRSGAARLAKALCERLGDYVVIFTNSGAETVEAAIKHAYLERQRPVYWAVENAFHGKTLGAIQLTQSYREPFSRWGPEVHFFDPYDPEQWSAEDADRTAAVYLEPIQGEGGVRPLPQPFVEWLVQTCRRHDIPIVVDEIQTGLGRTGTFLASTQLGLEPDYICLSKGLGCGLAKIGALLIRRERFVSDFSLKHTSTFAEDDRGCLLALKGLEILDRDRLAERSAALGEYALRRLEAARERFPRQVKEVRGRGLMIGLELHDLSESPSNSLRLLSQEKYLGYLAAAYLLNVHQIRVAPTLSHPFTIRVEPSAYIEEGDLERFVDAFSTFCEALEATDVTHLASFQVNLPPPPITDRRGERPYRRERPREARRVAFLTHLILPEHATHWDPSLGGFSAEQLEAFMEKPSRVLGPAIYDQWHVRSRAGAEVHYSHIGLDLMPRQIMKAIRERDTGWIMEKIEEAVALARDEGCSTIGLGAYTSIVAGNCQRVKTEGIALTSGNSLTVGMGLLALRSGARELGIELRRSSLGVVAATGNIASTYAIMMAPRVAGLVLVVHDEHSPRLQSIVREINRVAPKTGIIVTSNLEALRNCSLLVTASNSPEPLVYPEHLSQGPVIICDISLPSDIAPQVSAERPDVMVIHGGVVRLPCNDDLAIAGLPLERGHVYACMAETLLMGLEGINTHGSYGLVTPEGVEQALAMAEKHGFELGELLTKWTY